jgi:membrane fusion protein (multidrug efflux system)
MTASSRKRASVIALIAIGLAFAVQLLASGGSTRELQVSNALVTGRAVEVIAPQTGLVSSSLLQPYTWVRQGELALVLNEAEYNANREQARQQLQSALLARVNACLLMAVQDAEQQNAEVAVRLAQADYARAVELNGKKFISSQALEDRSLTLEGKLRNHETRSLEASRLRSDALRPLLLSDAVGQAVVGLRKALASKSRHFIYVPRDSFVYGPVARRGDTVAEGTVLARLVPKGPIEVEALVLETQLADLQPGTEALVHFDAVAEPARRGTVVAVTPAIAAMFAPVVRPNMDSNWIKVNQRVPVVVRLDNVDADHMPPLGSSSEVTFFPGRTRSLDETAATASSAPEAADVDAELMASVDDIMNRTQALAIEATAGVSQCTQSISRLWNSWKLQ